MNSNTAVRSLIEHWLEERERATVKPEHALVAVRELHLTEAGEFGGSRCHSKETRPSGKSKPPIRDMDRTANQVDHIMRAIGYVNDDWRRALEGVVGHGTVDAASKASGRNRSTLYIEYACGVAAFQMEMVHCGMG